MDELLSNRKVLIITGISILVMLIAWVLFTIISQTQGKQQVDEQVALYSPVTQTSDSLAVNYGSNIVPNDDAVVQRFKIFDEKAIPLPNKLKEDIIPLIPKYLQSLSFYGSYDVVYIHISKDSVKVKSIYNYSFEFYTDSPERYYKVTSTETGYPLMQQIPWTGVR